MLWFTVLAVPTQTFSYKGSYVTSAVSKEI